MVSFSMAVSLRNMAVLAVSLREWTITKVWFFPARPNTFSYTAEEEENTMVS